MRKSLQLYSCKTLDELNDLLQESIELQIGTCGGRKVEFLDETQVEINDLVRRLDLVYIKSDQEAKSNKLAINIAKRIKTLDERGEQLLNSNNLFIRLLTFIRQWVGNIGIDRKSYLEKMIGLRIKDPLDLKEELRLQEEEEIRLAEEKRISDQEKLKALENQVANEIKKAKPIEEKKDEEGDKRVIDAESGFELVPHPSPTPAMAAPAFGSFGSPEGDVSLAKAFSFVKKDAATFVSFATQLATVSTKQVAYLAGFLEKLDWPTEELKREQIPLLLSTSFDALKVLDLSEHPVELENHQNIQTTLIWLDTNLIFGRSDFITDPVNLSLYLTQAIGTLLISQGEALLKALKGVENPKTMGLSILLAQTTKCRFSAEMISPLLPYIANVPGLLSLNMINVGQPPPKIVYAKPQGFGDKHMKSLLNIGTKQPYLQEMIVNDDAMTDSAAEDANKCALLIKHNRKVTSEEILSGLKAQADKLM